MRPPVIALVAGIVIAGVIVLVWGNRGGSEDMQPVTGAVTQERATSAESASDPSQAESPQRSPATDPASAGSGATRADPSGLGPHYPDPRRDTPGDTSMSIDEARKIYGESGIVPGTEPGIPAPGETAGRARTLGGGVTGPGGPDASQTAEGMAPPPELLGKGPVGLPPEAGDPGITGPAPEAGDPGTFGPAPEASDTGIPGPAPEASDPGITYPAPEASGEGIQYSPPDE